MPRTRRSCARRPERRRRYSAQSVEGTRNPFWWGDILNISPRGACLHPCFMSRHPAGSAASDFRRKAARGRENAGGLQHPEGVYASPGAASPWRNHRAVPDRPRQEVQLRQEHLPTVRHTHSPSHEGDRGRFSPFLPVLCLSEGRASGANVSLFPWSRRVAARGLRGYPCQFVLCAWFFFFVSSSAFTLRTIWASSLAS